MKKLVLAFSLLLFTLAQVSAFACGIEGGKHSKTTEKTEGSESVPTAPETT